MPEWIVAPHRAALSGEERIGSARVVDFWKFALGDLRVNNARGYLAEFIVGGALGLDGVRRVEWDSFDILWEERDITIEVKSSSYLQTWDQRKLSRIEFSGLKGTRYHPRHDFDPSGQRYNAMVYVFCVHTATDHEKNDPLDLEQWAFYVVPRRKIAELNQKSIGLSRVASLAGSQTPLAMLAAAISEAAVDELPDHHDEWWIV